MDSLEEIIKRTKEVHSLLLKSGSGDFGKEARLLDLVEEVGELANAVLVEEGHKSEGRRKADLKDSVCDVLFDLVLLAEQYGIDLGEEYGKMLKELEERIKRGEFK